MTGATTTTRGRPYPEGLRRTLTIPNTLYHASAAASSPRPCLPGYSQAQTNPYLTAHPFALPRSWISRAELCQRGGIIVAT